MRLLACFFVLSLFSPYNVFASEQLLTKCKVINYAYVHLESFNADRSFLKPNPTNYESGTQSTKEEYWLTFDNDKKLPLKYNIYYKSLLQPDNNWNIADDIKTKKARYFIFNDNVHNLVLNLVYLGVQQRTYHFNLDVKYNGHMVLTDVRWKSWLDIINGSSLYFCECKGATK